MRLLVAKPRGFCAGVDRAIDTVEVCLDLFGAPVYVRHAIVHNRHVVDDLQRRGAVFVEELSAVPEGAVCVFSAHGVAPTVRAEAAARNLQVIDATCPLVTRVHLEAVKYARAGYRVLLIGHRGHVEVAGTLGEAPAASELVANVEEAERVTVPDPERVAVLTQTTLSVDDADAVLAVLRRRFPTLVTPPKGDICYATTNRQAAVKALARDAEVILVVGSAESSNANRLVEVARHAGAKAYRVDGARDLELAWVERAASVGVTSGASTPERMVDEVVAKLRSLGAGEPETVEPLQENVWFPLPPELVRAARDSGREVALVEKHRIRANSKLSTG